MHIVAGWLRPGQCAACIVLERRQGYAALEMSSLFDSGVCFWAVQGVQAPSESAADQLQPALVAHRALTGTQGTVSGSIDRMGRRVASACLYFGGNRCANMCSSQPGSRSSSLRGRQAESARNYNFLFHCETAGRIVASWFLTAQLLSHIL